MICYLDKTFCPFWKKCNKVIDKYGVICERALTDKVYEDACLWWENDNPPIAVYTGKPDCFEDGDAVWVIDL